MNNPHRSHLRSRRRAAALALSAALLAALPARATDLTSSDQYTSADRSGPSRYFPTSPFVGGAVYYSNGFVNSPDHDYIVLTGNSASHDQRAAFGGAIAAWDDLTLGTVTSGDILLQSNDAESSNFTNYNGGRTYAGGGALYAGGAVTLTAGGDLTAAGNRAIARGNNGEVHAFGGAVASWRNGVALSASGDITLRANAASGDWNAMGGAAYANGDLRVAGRTVTILSNDATAGGNEAAGGALYASGREISGGPSSVTVSADGAVLIASNAASSDADFARGGAVYAEGAARVCGAAVTIDANEASSGGTASGGAIFSERGSVEISADGIALTNNRARGASYASGGAVYAYSNIVVAGRVVAILSNDATAPDDSRGGALFANNGSVTVGGAAAERVVFSGNRAGRGGAVWAAGSIDVTAKNIVVGTPADTFWSDRGGSITLAGSLDAAPGASFVAKSGKVEVKNGVLTLTGVRHGDDVTVGQLVRFAGRTGTELHYADLSIAGSVVAGQSYDVAFAGVTAEGQYPELGKVKNPRYTVALTFPGQVLNDDDTDTVLYKLTAFVASADLVWNAGDGAWFAGSTTGGAPKNWTHRSAPDIADWFLNGDSVTFTAERQGTVNVSGDVRPAAMTVTGGAYMFKPGENGGTITTGTLTGSGSDTVLTFDGVRVSADCAAVEGVSSVVVRNARLDAGDSAAYGGAIHANSGVTLSADSGITVSDNKAVGVNKASGGAIRSQGDVTLTGDAIIVQSNDATASAVGSVADGSAVGGAIAAGDSLTLTGGSITVQNNRAAGTSTDTPAGTSEWLVTVVGGALTSQNWYGNMSLTAAGGIVLKGNEVTAAGSGPSVQTGGGAIYASGVSVTLTGGTITVQSNKATATNTGQNAVAGGGAIDAYCIVSLASSGDIVLKDNEATATSVNTAGSAEARGGAISAVKKDGPGTVTLSADGGISLEGNTVTASGGSEADARGGAVWADGGVTLTATNGAITFSGNKANASEGDASGGAVYASGDITLSGASISVLNNKAESTSDNVGGGAIYSSYSSVRLTADGPITFSGNIASGSVVAEGGAIEAAGDVSLMSGGTIKFSGNKAVSTGEGMGGAIVARQNLVLSADTGIEFSGNSVSGDVGASGGAVAANGDVSLMSGGTITVRGNGVGGTSNSGGTAGAGAIYARDNLTLTAGSTIEVSGNRAEGSYSVTDEMGGGALYALSEEIRLTGGAIIVQSNDAVNWSGDVDGGAIAAVGGSVTLSADGDVLVRGNTASGEIAGGGAVYAGGISGDVTLKGGSIVVQGNAASASEDYAYNPGDGSYIPPQNHGIATGGALYASRDITLTGGAIIVQSNDVSGLMAYGGAMYAKGDIVVKGSSISLQSNDVKGTVVAYGGALASSGDMTLSAGEVLVSGNSACGDDAYGGALCTTLGSFDLTGGTIAVLNNEAAGTNNVLGGAIYAHIVAALSADASIELTGNRAEASVSADAKGGAIYSEYAIRLYAASIDARGNEAVSSADSVPSGAFGGALYANNDPVTLSADAVTFSDSRAVSAKGTAQGGAIYAEEQSVTISAGSIMFDGNRAVNATGSKGSASGGALYASGDINLTGDSIMVLSNDATAADNEASGGALYSLNGDIRLTGGTISVQNNKAMNEGDTAAGGALCANSGTVTLSADSSIELTGNRADGRVTARGGAIIAKSLFMLSGGTITVRSNDAATEGGSTYGGALYADGGAVTLSADSITFSGNRAIVVYGDGWSRAQGGAIFAGEGSVTLTAESGPLTLSGNTASGDFASGGAIYAWGDSVTLTGGSIMVQSNDATSANDQVDGGAIHAQKEVTLTSSGTITLTGNTATETDAGDNADVRGGAVWALGDVTLTSSGDMALTGNKVKVSSAKTGDILAVACGGAIYMTGSGKNVTLTSSGNMKIEGNTATATASGETNDEGFIDIYASGGAVWADDDVTLIASGDMEIKGNTAAATATDIGNGYANADVSGGAIHTEEGGVTLTADGGISLEGNTVTASGGSKADAKGGAIWAGVAQSTPDVTLTGASIDVRNNAATAAGESRSAEACGGAIGANGGVSLTATNGAITFSGNSVTATGNGYVKARGGAVWAEGGISLTAKDVFVKTPTDTFWSENDSITITGSLTAAPGASFAAPAGVVTVKEGVLTLTGVEHADDVKASELTGFAGHSVTLDYTDLSIAGAEAVGRSYDIAVVGIAAQGGALNLGTVKNPRYTVTSTDLNGGLEGELAALGDGYESTKLTAFVASADLVWNAGSGTWYAGTADDKNWVHSSETSVADWFLNGPVAEDELPDFGDSVTFTGEKSGTVTVSGEVAPSMMTVTGGEYAFVGGGDSMIRAGTVRVGGNASVALGVPLISNTSYEQTDGRLTLDKGAAIVAVDTVLVNGTLNAAPGTGLISVNVDDSETGVVRVGGGELQLVGVEYSVATEPEQLVTFIGRTVDLSGATLKLDLPEALANKAGEKSADFAVAITNTDGALLLPKADNYRNGTIVSGDVLPSDGTIDLPVGAIAVYEDGEELPDGKDEDDLASVDIRKLTLVWKPASLTWKGGVDGTWVSLGDVKGWTNDDTKSDDVFYQGDHVTFAANGAIEKVSLSGDIVAGSMTVDGNYRFEGGDGLTVGELSVTGGNAEFARAVTAEKAALSGGTLSLQEPLTVAGAFVHDGGTLKLDAAAAENAALLNGSGTAKLTVTDGALAIEGVGKIEKGASKSYKVAENFAAASLWWGDGAIMTDAAGMRVTSVGQPTDDNTGFAVTVSSLGNIPLIWNGGSTAWTENDGKKNWLVDADGTTDDYWNGDSVTFTARNAGTVTLSGDLTPAAMTVTGGEYTFEGDGRLNVAGSLTVSGGDVRFAREIGAYKGVLSGTGTKLTLEQTLRLTGAFVQNGGTLIVDLGRLNGAAALSGEGKAELKIESGALELIGDTATPEGNTYTIASGFGSIAKVWADDKVSGQAEGRNVQYSVFSDDTSVRVSVTCDEEPKPEPKPQPDPEPKPQPEPGPEPEPEKRRVPFALTAGQSLRNAMNVGTSLQNRGAELLNAPVNIMNYANGFLPLEKGKVGGVWASTWYNHARVDNDTADMKFKNYGVTIGADKQFGTGVAGLAINLGKTEGCGKGKFDGSDSDGKHIGVSLYGGRQIANGKITLTGDIGYNWHSDDYDSTDGGDYYRARKAKSRVFTVGGTAWWNLRNTGRVNVKPFVGLRYSHFNMDDMTVKKNGSDWATIGGESVSQWTVPIGVKFDWTPVTTKKGWKVKPAAELAYVYAGGDRAMTVRETQLSGGSATRSTQMLTDKNNFRASLGLDAKCNNLTIGVGVNALLSSGQKDVAVNATLRWDL